VNFGSDEEDQVMRFSPMGFVVVDLFAANEGLTPQRQMFYGMLGGILGNSAVGLGVTLALANQEAEALPAPTPPQSASAGPATAPTLPAVPHQASHKAGHSS
jgi:hypothetical protein